MLAKHGKSRSVNPNKNAYWMSYSDMMAALLLMFVLLLFLSFSRYMTLQETKEAELADKEAQLSQQEEELAQTRQELTEQQDELLSMRTLLNTKQLQLESSNWNWTRRRPPFPRARRSWRTAS